jgi:hypothetical protein
MPIITGKIPLLNVLWLRPHCPNFLYGRRDDCFYGYHAANLRNRTPIFLTRPPIFYRISSAFIDYNILIISALQDNTIIASMKTPFNKYLYLGFLLLGIYQAAANKNYMEAASQMGIALAFDPFDTEQPWPNRPTWQKATLIVHLALVAALFGLALGLNDK